MAASVRESIPVYWTQESARIFNREWELFTRYFNGVLMLDQLPLSTLLRRCRQAFRQPFRTIWGAFGQSQLYQSTSVIFRGSATSDMLVTSGVSLEELRSSKNTLNA